MGPYGFFEKMGTKAKTLSAKFKKLYYSLGCNSINQVKCYLELSPDIDELSLFVDGWGPADILSLAPVLRDSSITCLRLHELTYNDEHAFMIVLGWGEREMEAFATMIPKLSLRSLDLSSNDLSECTSRMEDALIEGITRCESIKNVFGLDSNPNLHSKIARLLQMRTDRDFQLNLLEDGSSISLKTLSHSLGQNS